MALLTRTPPGVRGGTGALVAADPDSEPAESSRPPNDDHRDDDRPTDG